MTSATHAEVAALLARAHRIGADARNTNYAGGNTSVKATGTDPVTGGDTELLWVKGSGGDLGTLTEAGLAVLRLDRVRALKDVYPGVEREDEMVPPSTTASTARAVRPRPSTRRCMPWSTPLMSTICIRTRGSRWRARPTGRN